MIFCPFHSSLFHVYAYDYKTHTHMKKSSSFDLGKGQKSNMHKIRGNAMQIWLVNEIIWLIIYVIKK